MLTTVQGGTGAGRTMHRHRPEDRLGLSERPPERRLRVDLPRVQLPREAAEGGRPLMLIADRVCVRCSSNEDRTVTTRWTNQHDEGLELACTVCGLTAASALTADEAARVKVLDAKPVKRRRRSYVVL
jgi:hypothetical protein